MNIRVSAALWLFVATFAAYADEADTTRHLEPDVTLEGDLLAPLQTWSDEALIEKRYRTDVALELQARLRGYDSENRARLRTMVEAAPPVDYPQGLSVAALVECLDERTQEREAWEAAALELAARVAAGDARVAAEAAAALEAHFRGLEPERLPFSIGVARIILPPGDRIDLLMRIFAADTSAEGAIGLAMALRDSSDLCGAALFERRHVLAAVEKAAGERSDEFRMAVGCALVQSGPFGRRTLTALGWNPRSAGSECADPSRDAEMAQSLMMHYENASPEEPMARVRTLGRLADRVTDYGLVRDYLRTELPLHFELADHPEGPSALAHAALAAVETGDVYFVPALRAAAETMRAGDASSLRTPPPGIEGGWESAFANLAAKLDAAAERLEALAATAP